VKLEGSSAFVTGAASGLGRATVEALAARGARVTCFDRDADGASRAAAAVDGLAAPGDVTVEDDVAGAVTAATARFGAPRVLVNCAGIGPPRRMLGRDGPMPLAEFEHVLRVNLIGTFNVTRLVAQATSALAPLADGERGVIVMTASVAAFEGQVGQAAYAASKGGIVALTLPLARELAQFGIRVVTIAPGFFRTPLLEALPAPTVDALVASIPFPKRLGEPAEFAALVVNCCENPSLNGTTIRLDGALRLPPR
jgi:NAD(P)-dependent dehydrogenase (short-subunit alcohol dehydrogenase family)